MSILRITGTVFAVGALVMTASPASAQPAPTEPSTLAPAASSAYTGLSEVDPASTASGTRFVQVAAQTGEITPMPSTPDSTSAPGADSVTG